MEDFENITSDVDEPQCTCIEQLPDDLPEGMGGMTIHDWNCPWLTSLFGGGER